MPRMLALAPAPILAADIDTRRRAASDLVRGLCTHWEQQVTEICSAFVGTLLAEYASNAKAKWQSKDAAIFLVAALVIRCGAGRRRSPHAVRQEQDGAQGRHQAERLHQHWRDFQQPHPPRAAGCAMLLDAGN